MVCRPAGNSPRRLGDLAASRQNRKMHQCRGADCCGLRTLRQGCGCASVLGTRPLCKKEVGKKKKSRQVTDDGSSHTLSYLWLFHKNIQPQLPSWGLGGRRGGGGRARREAGGGGTY